MKISEKHDVSLNDIINFLTRPKRAYRKQTTSKGSIIGAAVAGFAVGCAVALLYTPESGSELRDDISSLLRDTNEKLVALASDALDKVV